MNFKIKECREVLDHLERDSTSNFNIKVHLSEIEKTNVK